MENYETSKEVTGMRQGGYDSIVIPQTPIRSIDSGRKRQHNLQFAYRFHAKKSTEHDFQ